MKLYIDKANVLSLLSSSKDEKFLSVIKMLRNNLDVGFNFEKDSIKGNETIVKFLTQFTSGRNESLKVSFTPDLAPNRPLDNKFLNSVYQNKRCILLVDDQNVKPVQTMGNCLLGGLGEEIDTLEKLMIDPIDYGFDRELSIGTAEFNSWTAIAKYNHPFYDLIILDRYILKVDEVTLKKNIIELISQFNTNKKAKINIVLFTLKEPNYSWTYNQLRKLIVEAVVKKTGIEPNFTLVWSIDPEKARHDRHILTNYFWIKSGDSFNYFLATTGKVRTTGDTLNIKSLAKEDYRKAVDLIISNTQAKVTDLVKLNPTFIEGDKISSFLKFTL